MRTRDKKARSVVSGDLVPFAVLLALVMGSTIALDALLHRSGLVWVGRYLGIPGSILILASFVYSLRKRNIITFGTPKTLLAIHQTLALTGTVMVLVHAGIHVYAILPWLALLAMLVNVISGLTGQFLLRRARRTIADERAGYADQGLSDDAIEKELFWDAVVVDAMKKWRSIHLPITLAFTVLSVTHIVSVLVFWQWR